MKQKKAEKQTPYLMKSPLRDRWFVVTRWEQKRGMCAMGPDAGKEYDYLIAKEKFDCTDQMQAIFKAEKILRGVKGRPAR